MRAEREMERTWRVGQEEIVRAAGVEGALGRREWRLDGGPYRARYSRNGRCVCGLYAGVRSCDANDGAR